MDEDSRPEINTNEKKTKKRNRKENVDGMGGGVFEKSLLVQRTPPLTPTLETGAKDPSRNEDADSVVSTPDAGWAPSCGSPIEDHIAKARRHEEEELQNCKRTLEMMRKAIKRQPNISADVKKGILLLEESLDVISSLRGSWKLAESCKNNKQTQTSPDAQMVGKRAATSPAAGWSEAVSRREKRQRKAEDEEKREAIRRVPPAEPTESASGESVATTPKPPQAKNATKRKKPRSEAILIKPSEGKSYADILRAIRGGIKPEDTDTEVKGVRKTRAGDVLLELGAKTKNKEGFATSVRAALGEAASSVRSLEPKTSIEVRDLDEFTTEDEVRAAIVKETKDISGRIAVFLTKANARAQKTAIVELSTTAANTILAASRLKVGYMHARVRHRVVVTRCYKCFGYGHEQSTCQGPDRRAQKICIRCGEKDHKKAECGNDAKCFLCAEIGLADEALSHIPGTGACRIFRAALEKAKNAKK